MTGTTSGSWTVNPASITVAALGGSSTYGSSPSNPGLSATGLQNGQNVNVLTGLSNLFGVTGASSAGNYTMSVAGTLTNSNYTVTSATSGTWTVNPASVSVTALGGSSTYGALPANPGLSATGLENGDNVGALTGLHNSFSITNTSDAGNYTLSVAGTLTNANYTVASIASGSWTVNPASVSVTALGGSSTYGSSPANPGLSASGLQNGQDANVLTGLRNSFGVTNSSDAGNYTLGVAGALTNSNYTVGSTSSGSWTVDPAPVNVTALGGSSILGASPSNPGLSASGLQNGQGVGALTGLRNSFGITSASNAGSYVTEVAGSLTNSNYALVGTKNGSWTVTTPVQGSSADGSSHYIPGASGTGPPPAGNTGTLDGLSGASSINIGHATPATPATPAAPAAPATPATPAAAAAAVRPATTNAKPATPVSPPPPSLDTPLAMPSPQPEPAIAPTPRATTDCSDGQGDGCEAVAPPNKPAAATELVLSELNRTALTQEIDRGITEMRNSSSFTRIVVATVAAGTSLSITVGIVARLLRGGALLSALLTSMPVWRGFDPMMVLTRRKRREEDEDEPPSDVDRMFEDARSDRLAPTRANVNLSVAA